MSVISSFASTPDFYQAAGVKTLAHSTEAVGGTEQAFADAERRKKQNDGEEGQAAVVASSEEAGQASGAATDHHRYILNVTA